MGARSHHFHLGRVTRLRPATTFAFVSFVPKPARRPFGECQPIFAAFTYPRGFDEPKAWTMPNDGDDVRLHCVSAGDGAGADAFRRRTDLAGNQGSRWRDRSRLQPARRRPSAAASPRRSATFRNRSPSINSALMQAQGATSLADALRNVPGITMGAAEGGSIGNNFNLRGFSARTDLYLDGMRDRGQYYRDVFSLDAVEVLQGPSSMLFGRGSTGGIINQVSKLPSLTPFGNVALSAGTQPRCASTARLQPADRRHVGVSHRGDGARTSIRRAT